MIDRKDFHQSVEKNRAEIKRAMTDVNKAEATQNKYDDPKQEFDRGYNFGKEDGANELMKTIIKQGSKYMEEFETDSIVVKIPREYFLQLRQKASETA